MLIISEGPLYFFTLLDLLQLKSLYKYRVHYSSEVSSHLGTRVYPPVEALVQALKVTEFNLLFAYLIPGSLGIAAANKLGIFVYDTDREVSWTRIIKEAFVITVVADSMFYWVHRMVHLPQFYQTFHKQHHEWKYSMALAHHYMTFKEALLFAGPQALPPLMLIPFMGKSHLVSMWVAFYFTQLCGMVGHAGYHLPLPSWFPFFKASYHDYHHVDFDCNYAANYEFTDALYGTLVRAPLASAAEIAKHAGQRVHCYVTHMAKKA
ncbi:hypothetical protein BASA81_010240 [Batrachochytrium salamandrivorans]|nr:hypothetical protein BASA81_010240 [Batrachochytrium salamandrivorans]